MSLPESVVSSLKEHSPIIENNNDTLSTSNQEKYSPQCYILLKGGKRLRASLPYLVGDLWGESKYSTKLAQQ